MSRERIAAGQTEKLDTAGQRTLKVCSKHTNRTVTDLQQADPVTRRPVTRSLMIDDDLIER